MKDLRRKETARRIAEAYAPAPVDTRLMYGVVAAALMLVATIAAGAFYAVDLAQHVVTVALLTLGAFAAGLANRHLQASRHHRAHRSAYDSMPGADPRTEPSAPSAAEAAPLRQAES
jgi:hypothetical protein